MTRAFRTFALLIILAPAEIAGAVDSGTGPDIPGTWLVEARNRDTRRFFRIEVRISDDLLRSGTFFLPETGVTGAFERASTAGRHLQVECTFPRGGGSRTIDLRGNVAGDMWVGRYQIRDDGGAATPGGRFIGRRIDDPGQPAGNSLPNFPGVWLGYYEAYGERFRIRFDIADREGGKGTVSMPDESIRADVTGWEISGDEMTLSAAWMIPGTNSAARIELAGKLKGDRWHGEYSVFVAGKTQPAAKGPFHARQSPPKGSANRERPGIPSLLGRPPQPNGLLEGIWQGVYRHDDGDFGLAVEIRVSNGRYVGDILLPDDRLRATIFYASDADGHAQAIGIVDEFDDEGDKDSILINMGGEIHGNVWRGICAIGSDSARMESHFTLARRPDPPGHAEQ